MTARVDVVDTNVVVSGLLISGIDAPSSRILDSIFSGALRFALSVELLRTDRMERLRLSVYRSPSKALEFRDPATSGATTLVLEEL